MITHLISTTEFVKLLLNTSPYDLPDEVELNPLRVIHNYVNFISQKPELWMFVPCDKEGNVLEEPGQYNSWLNKKSIDWGKVPFNIDLHTFEKYKKAQSKVLFKCWKFVKKTKRGYYKLQKDDETTMYLDVSEGLLNGTGHSNTLEYMQFISTELLELTETALKQIL